MEKPPTNRLREDSHFYEQVRNQILDELTNLSRIFDDQMANLGYGKIWQEVIDKIKGEEKLGVEPEVRKIVFEIAQKSGLSNTELDYLLNLLFKPRKQRNSDG